MDIGRRTLAGKSRIVGPLGVIVAREVQRRTPIRDAGKHRVRQRGRASSLLRLGHVASDAAIAMPEPWLATPSPSIWRRLRRKMRTSVAPT